MDRIRIRGGNRLNGTIPISGAKNAALPLMIVSLLSPGTLTLSNVPRLADVRLLQRILQNHGIDITVAGKRAGQTGMGDVMHLSAKDIVDTTGLNADLADVVLYHRCVFDARHCGLAEEFRAARREKQRRLQEEGREREASEGVAQRVKRQRRG